MTIVTYSQTGLAAFLSGYLNRRVTRQAVHSRLTRGRIAPGTASPPDAPVRWTQWEVEAIALAWDQHAERGHRKPGRVPGSRRDLAERRRAAESTPTVDLGEPIVFNNYGGLVPGRLVRVTPKTATIRVPAYGGGWYERKAKRSWVYAAPPEWIDQLMAMEAATETGAELP